MGGVGRGESDQERGAGRDGGFSGGERGEDVQDAIAAAVAGDAERDAQVLRTGEDGLRGLETDRTDLGGDAFRKGCVQVERAGGNEVAALGCRQSAVKDTSS